MIVPASRVKDFIDPKSSQAIELRDVSGALIGNIHHAEALGLVADDAVVGKCSRTKLKYLRLLAEETLPPLRRANSPQEALRRMVSSRKFIHRERLTETCHITSRQEWTGVTVWKHKYCPV